MGFIWSNVAQAEKTDWLGRDGVLGLIVLMVVSLGLAALVVSR
jgi:hypothetical protein